MENSLESNERTLIMFESVCAGLASCLNLVHADIRQMTDHRNQLAQLEQEQIRAKCKPAEQLFTEQDEFHLNSAYSKQQACDNYQQDSYEARAQVQKASHRNKSSGNSKQARNNELKRLSCHKSQSSIIGAGTGKESANYLDGLKLLDRRLAESFNQAFKLNDEQKFDLAAKNQASGQAKTSIFQVLLGKTLNNRKREQSQVQSTLVGKNKLIKDEAYQVGLASERVVDNKLIIDDINRQIRLAMQYIKQLEAHLFKIEDLRPKYEMHLKMGLLVRGGHESSLSKHNHYQSLSSLKSNSNKSNSRYSYNSIHSSTANLNNFPHPTANGSGGRTTIREFIENINKIEQEFESYMGSFLLAITDIQGFARVCQGDVFEINIKYGLLQKFKTRISVLKDNKQRCDNREVVFKAKINDILAIKAYECKGLGKRVLLGHKLCETRDLFTAQSQLMTISLNQTGSIKLNLIITWNPLHMAPNSSASLSSSPGLDISHISLPPTPISSSTLSSVSSSAPSINGGKNHGKSISTASGITTTININSSQPNCQTNSGPNNRSNDSFSSDNSQHMCQARQIHNHNHHHSQQHNYHDQHQNGSIYQTIDPTYGYYIPPPDYITTNEIKYSENGV